MSIYVPNESILRCDRSVKVSRLKVTSQTQTLVVGDYLKGTWVDKMDENFLCPYVNSVALAAGQVAVGQLGKLGGFIDSFFETVGGLIGGISGAVKGWDTGSEAGGAVGAEIGEILGTAAGAGLGGIKGAVTGAAKGGYEGYIQGAAIGGQVGEKIGRQSGEVAGGMVGVSVGTGTGAVVGAVEGADAGRTAGGSIGREAGGTTGSIAGAGAGFSIMGPAGIVAGAKAGNAVGGVVGDMQGQITGAALGGVAGGIGGAVEGAGKGHEIGKELGGDVGEMAGRVAGSAAGGYLGGVTGTAKGAVKGSAEGYVQGAAKGGELGEKAGQTVGEFVGGIKGAIDGFKEGKEDGKQKGKMFFASYLGGLLPSIPPICAIITSPVWTLYHPTLLIEGKFALLHTSVLPCAMGGTVTVWIEDLTPHLRRALVSEAIYYNEDNEAKMKEKLSDDKFKEWKDKQAAIFKKLADNKITKVTPKEGLNDLMKTDSGFMAEIYSYKNEKGKDVYIMAFKGTDNATQAGTDWKNNAQNATGMEAEQYTDTEKAARAFAREYPDHELEFAGHSKAGGQATFAAAVTKREATVFNPAGVHDATFKRGGTSREVADQYVTSFHSHNSDILNTLQDHTYGLVPQAAGDRIGIKTKVPYLLPDPVEGHNMDHLIEVLQKEVDRYKKLVKAEDM